MTQDNSIVQCPADDCSKTFDNKKRFTKHVTKEHPPEEVLETEKPGSENLDGSINVQPKK